MKQRKKKFLDKMINLCIFQRSRDYNFKLKYQGASMIILTQCSECFLYFNLYFSVINSALKFCIFLIFLMIFFVFIILPLQEILAVSLSKRSREL